MKLKSSLVTAVLAASSLSAAPFLVTVDTSTLATGATGFLDIQFNGAGNPAPAGTATVTDFAGDNVTVDPSLATTFGAVSGDLTPGPLVLANTDPFNDYFIPFAITGAGSGFSFTVALSGDILVPPPGNLNGTDFALLMFAADGVTPLLTGDGQLARIAVSALGSVSAEGFPPGTVAPVPEPSATITVLAGLAVLAAMGRNLSKKSKISPAETATINQWSVG